jgi:hypothetical protein
MRVPTAILSSAGLLVLQQLNVQISLRRPRGAGDVPVGQASC